MMNERLTAGEWATLRALAGYLSAHGYAPSLRDVMALTEVYFPRRSTVWNASDIVPF